MDKNSIIKSVKRQEEEKVAFSLKLPATLKEQLQTLAEKESISMNALIVASLQSLMDDECGKAIAHAKAVLSDCKKHIMPRVLYFAENGVDDREEAEELSALQGTLHSIDTFMKKGE